MRHQETSYDETSRSSRVIL